LSKADLKVRSRDYGVSRQWVNVLVGRYRAEGDAAFERRSRRLHYDAKGRDKPLLVVVTGLDKPFRTTFSDADYAAVKALDEEYRRRNPRSIA
jgi:hypothetical protein